jgi:hypothetical protein
MRSSIRHSYHWRSSSLTKWHITLGRSASVPQNNKRYCSVLPLLSGPMERSHIDVNGFHPLSLSKDVSVPFMARVPVSKDHSERHGLQGSDFCLVTSSSYCHICEGTTSSLSHYHHWLNLTLLPHQLARPISMTSSNLSSIYQVIIENDCRGLLNAKALFDEGDQWRHNLRHRGFTEDGRLTIAGRLLYSEVWSESGPGNLSQLKGMKHDLQLAPSIIDNQKPLS